MQALTAEPAPLVTGADEVIRIRDTRVTLESVIAAFADGATAEEIAQKYPAMSLAEVYQVIGYYLGHVDEVGAYLEKRREETRGVKRANEARYSPEGVRDRLMARKRT